jgi:hypothetical protein
VPISFASLILTLTFPTHCLTITVSLCFFFTSCRA